MLQDMTVACTSGETQLIRVRELYKEKMKSCKICQAYGPLLLV